MPRRNCFFRYGRQLGDDTQFVPVWQMAADQGLPADIARRGIEISDARFGGAGENGCDFRFVRPPIAVGDTVIGAELNGAETDPRQMAHAALATVASRHIPSK